MHGARQGVGKSSVNKMEGRAVCITQEQSSIKGRVELKVADELFYIHLFFT